MLSTNVLAGSLAATTRTVTIKKNVQNGLRRYRIRRVFIETVRPFLSCMTRPQAHRESSGEQHYNNHRQARRHIPNPEKLAGIRTRGETSRKVREENIQRRRCATHATRYTPGTFVCRGKREMSVNNPNTSMPCLTLFLAQHSPFPPTMHRNHTHHPNEDESRSDNPRTRYQ